MMRSDAVTSLLLPPRRTKNPADAAGFFVFRGITGA